jgi:hypothetical protein
MTWTMSNRDVWAGWAQCVAEDFDGYHMPPYVAQACHPDCDQPSHAWAMLVGLQRERQALFSGERLPKEVVGITDATMEQAIQYLEHQMIWWADELAFGSYRDNKEWELPVVSEHVDG